MAGSRYSTTFDDLQEELKRFVEDDSPEFTTDIVNIIKRGQDRVARDLDLEMFQTIDSVTLSIGAATRAKPTGALMVRYYFLTATGKFIERRTPELCKAFGGSGVPKYFGDLNETTVILAPTPDAAYAAEVSWIRRPPKLTSNAPTNWLTNNAADLLLLACLIESEQYLIGDERIPVFKAEYQDKLASTGSYLRGLSRSEYKERAGAPEPSGVA